MSVEQRIAHLEKQNLQLKIAVFFAFVLFVLAFGTGAIQQKPHYVDARGFRLVDGNGKNWGGIALTAQGPMMLFKDERGNERLKLYLAKDGYAKLYMLDAEGNARLRIADSAEATGMAVSDENEKDRVVLGASKEGESFHLGQEERGLFKLDTDVSSASMFLMNPKGENRIAIASTPELAAVQISENQLLLGVAGGVPSFALTDSKKKAGISFSLTESNPALGMTDTNGKKRIAIGIIEHDVAVNVLDREENPRLMLSTVRDAAAITLANERGEATWSEKN